MNYVAPVPDEADNSLEECGIQIIVSQNNDLNADDTESKIVAVYIPE